MVPHRSNDFVVRTEINGVRAANGEKALASVVRGLRS